MEEWEEVEETDTGAGTGGETSVVVRGEGDMLLECVILLDKSRGDGIAIDCDTVTLASG